MVAHLLPKQRAAGSNPVSRSSFRVLQRDGTCMFHPSVLFMGYNPWHDLYQQPT